MEGGEGKSGRKPYREARGANPGVQMALGRGEVRLPSGRTLTEAEEEGVHAHAIDAEEAVGDEVGAHDHRLEEKRWG